MAEPTSAPLETTQVRVYEDDTSRLEALVEALRKHQPRASRPDAIRYLLDLFDIAQVHDEPCESECAPIRPEPLDTGRGSWLNEIVLSSRARRKDPEAASR